MQPHLKQTYIKLKNEFILIRLREKQIFPNIKFVKKSILLETDGTAD